jgi:hypothetical protein
MEVRGRGQVQGHAGERGGEVRPVIEVEPAQVVLVGLALSAVLAGDEPGHRFEHFRGAHDRPRLELPGGDRALARGARHPHEVLGRILELGDVAERARAGDHDVGGHGDGEHRVGRNRLCRRHDDVASDQREVDQLEGDDRGSGWHGVDAVAAFAVGHRGEHRVAALDVDDHARQHAAGFVHHATRDRAAWLRPCGGQRCDQHQGTRRHESRELGHAPIVRAPEQRCT